ncbi:hypothetical protein AGMMS49940_23380 [Spirochaetia bacterium]|nr:hypothetical protein AGMMS49940_23380 [Spirochaetia bacterium]
MAWLRLIGILILKEQYAVNLKQHADYFKKIQSKDLRKSLLPEDLPIREKLSPRRMGGCRRVINRSGLSLEAGDWKASGAYYVRNNLSGLVDYNILGQKGKKNKK